MIFNILSIDPSLSSTGYSIINANTRQIIRIGRYQTKNDIPEDDRIKNIVLELFDIYNSDDTIRDVVLEDGFANSKNFRAGLLLAKLRGAIITYFKISGVPVYTQEPTETRKNLGLKGNAKKEEVANKILELYPDLIDRIGPYSDKSNKQKTSDMYDSVCIGIAHLNKLGVDI